VRGQRGMKKVLLINPAIAYSTWRATLDIPNPDNIFIRLGLAYLASALKERGHQVYLLDLRTLSGWTEFEEEAERIGPDIVGISIHSIEMTIATEAARRLKRLLPDKPIVAGGIHPTMFPQECLQTGVFDYVIRGEGEISFPQLVENPGNFPRIFWGETPNLDEIPYPLREIWKDYRVRIWREPYGIKGFRFALPLAEMINTRGCPFRCTFCCGPGEQQLYTRLAPSGKRVPYIRGRSVENVIKEIKLLRERYGIRSIMFHDDQFIMKRSWVERFVQCLHEEGLVKEGLEWVTSTKADIICRHEDLIEKMAQAGLKLLIIGFESFSPRILRWFNKTATVEDNFLAAKICKKNGIKIWANYILGVPTEEGWRMEDDLMTVDGVLRIEPVHYSPSFYSPTPGSPLYSWYRDKGLILSERTTTELSERGPFTPKVKGVDYDFLRAIMIDDSVRD